MIKFGDDLHLAQEETAGFSGCFNVWISAGFGTQDLDSNLLFNAWVLCKIDFAHTPTAEEAQ